MTEHDKHTETDPITSYRVLRGWLPGPEPDPEPEPAGFDLDAAFDSLNESIREAHLRLLAQQEEEPPPAPARGIDQGVQVGEMVPESPPSAETWLRAAAHQHMSHRRGGYGW